MVFGSKFAQKLRLCGMFPALGVPGPAAWVAAGLAASTCYRRLETAARNCTTSCKLDVAQIVLR